MCTVHETGPDKRDTLSQAATIRRARECSMTVICCLSTPPWNRASPSTLKSPPPSDQLSNSCFFYNPPPTVPLLYILSVCCCVPVCFVRRGARKATAVISPSYYIHFFFCGERRANTAIVDDVSVGHVNARKCDQSTTICQRSIPAPSHIGLGTKWNSFDSTADLRFRTTSSSATTQGKRSSAPGPKDSADHGSRRV